LATVVMMVGPPGEPRTRKSFAVFKHDGRRHGRERALAGADRVGRALNESEEVGDALFGGEVVHFVVEQKAQAFGGDAGSEGIVERGGHGDGVAFGIDDGIVGGVFGLANGRNGTRPGFALELIEDRGRFRAWLRLA
jgi:hypothetical protein